MRKSFLITLLAVLWLVLAALIVLRTVARGSSTMAGCLTPRDP